MDEDGYICLTDFGVSKQLLGKLQLATTFCGTHQYMAPEVIEGSGTN